MPPSLLRHPSASPLITRRLPLFVLTTLVREEGGGGREGGREPVTTHETVLRAVSPTEVNYNVTAIYGWGGNSSHHFHRVRVEF